jgi:YHS domain-containing protein
MRSSIFGIKDPVCGTTVDQATALRAERDGEVFHFCSPDCRQALLSTPTGATVKAKAGAAVGRLRAMLFLLPSDPQRRWV